MKIFLAGGVSGNLTCAWKAMANSREITDEGFARALKENGFGDVPNDWIGDEGFFGRRERKEADYTRSPRGGGIDQHEPFRRIKDESFFGGGGRQGIGYPINCFRRRKKR